MSATRFTSTTTIPYVNACHTSIRPGARPSRRVGQHRRQHGDQVRFLTGTDDNSLKNVLAAQAEHLPTQELVDRNASAFHALREPLDLSFDDFHPHHRDPRHRPGVQRFWHACEAAAISTASTTKGCTA